MPTYKVTYFFVDNTNNVGWTENWFANGTNALAAGATQANYPAVRLACLMDTARLADIRVSGVGKPRDAVYLALGSNPVGLIPSATRKLAGVWDVLLCQRDISAGTVLGRMYMHMVPGDIFTGRLYTPQTPPAASWLTPFAALATELTGGSYFLRTKSSGSIVYVSCQVFTGLRRAERKMGRPFDSLRGRRKTVASTSTPAVERLTEFDPAIPPHAVGLRAPTPAIQSSGTS